MTIGSRLKEIRQAKGLTQKELAEPYYTHAYVSRIEADLRRPSPEALEHFAQRLGLDVEELRTGRPPTLVSEMELGLREARRLVSEGKITQAEDRFSDLRKKAHQHRLESLEARAIHGLGLCEERRGRFQDAIDLYKNAQSLLQEQRQGPVVESLAGEARCHQLLGDIRYAIHMLESALEVLEREHLNDPGSMLRIHATLIGAYFEVGLYDLAYSSAEQALRLVPNVQEPERLANMYLNAGWALNHKGRSKEAIEVLMRAEHLFEQMELKLEIGRARLARGMMLSRSGKLTRAKIELTAAYRVFADVESPVDEARSRNELASILRARGSIDEAVGHLEHSIELLSSTGLPGLLARSKRELGLCLADDDPVMAEKHLREAIELFEVAEEKPQATATCGHLGDLLSNRGDDTGAHEAYRKGIAILQETL